ncbi:glycosyltransferase [Polaribacter pectinis]|uniref:Glycosyltransferase n=1 Tax=Polaribacter pectinis TaxID=2738844 RepID=A0A7G9LCW7_9FLAO|nr:DUF6311 domain-containing protein [Polaribacter pectinis]QNM86466.1 glycosyltransferase [Polaribacter pectinis]
MFNTCIVIPCYNEETFFLHTEYKEFLKNNKEALVCFVNDGSSDDTSSCLKNLKTLFPNNVAIVNHKVNQGKAAAVKTGFNFCNNNFDFKYIAYLDADLAVSLEECYSLTSHLKKDIDFVFGSRVLRIGAVIERKKSRHLIGRVIATLISYILSLKVYDTQCGCKVFKKELSEKIFVKPFISKWLFDVEIFFRIIAVYGRDNVLNKLLEIPLNRWVDRGDSKVELTYFFKLWFDLLKIKKEYSNDKPIIKNKKRFSFFKPNWLLISVVILCLVFFQISYGLELIVPTNIDWMLSAYHDWGQHYLGWTYFREASWGFPLGNMYNYYYPLGTNVGFTDSIPLLALMLKPFSRFLTSDFQYFGAFMLLAFLLNAIFTVKILQLFKVNKIIILGAVIIIITSPLFLYRGMHPALTAHWLIIASFYYYLCPPSKLNPIKANWIQVLLFVLSAGIHPYLAAMVFGFSIILPLKNYFYDKSISLKSAIFFPIISISSGFFFWYILGVIGIKGSTSIAGAGNYGKSTFNLNSFINPYEYSSQFLSGLKSVSLEQLEGFSYLGLGMIIISLVVAIYSLYLVFDKRILKEYKYILPLFLFTILLLLFSISNIVTFGDEVLFEIPIPEFIKTLGGIFRANGRFCWPFYYFLVIFSIIIFSKLPINKLLKTGIFVFLIGLQVYDIQHEITSRDLEYGSFETKLNDDKKWIAIFSEFDEIITYPPYQNTMVYNQDYQDLMFLASKAKTPITTGYVARMKPTHKYLDSIQRNIVKGNFELGKKSLYLTTSNYINIFNVPIYQKKVSLKKLDNFILIYSNKIDIEKLFKNSNENQKTQDSIFNQIISTIDKNSTNFIKISNSLIKNTNNVKYGLDEVSMVNNALKVRGWAFNEPAETNFNDSIFISLTNKKDTYLFNTSLISRPDVTAYFKKQNIDSCGFDMSIYTNKLPKDEYDVGFVIRNKKIKAYGKTEHKFKTN